MQYGGFNSLASNMKKLSVNETKWSSLLARTRAFILDISIWIFDFGVPKNYRHFRETSPWSARNWGSLALLMIIIEDSRCLVSSRKWGNLHVAFPLLKINISKNPDSFHYQEYLWKVIYSSFLVFKLLNNLISCPILAALIHSLL